MHLLRSFTNVCLTQIVFHEKNNYDNKLVIIIFLNIHSIINNITVNNNIVVYSLPKNFSHDVNTSKNYNSSMFKIITLK